MNSDNAFNLSYVLTTYNKLSYLQVTLPDLIDACSDDEEIVIYDAGSTDGSKEYLQKFHREGKIHQFVSEKDYGEADGYNKAMLACKGTIIKIISDDDAYDFQAIRFCKKFMLQHKDVHLVAADGFGVNNLLQHNQFSRRSTIDEFKQWQKNKKPFIFCGLSILLRKDALPLLGLWSTNYLIIDFEYSLRVTSGKAKIGWFTGLDYVNIVNERSNSGTQWRRMEVEKEQLEMQYFNKRPIISFKQKDSLKNLLRPIKYKLISQRPANPLPYKKVYEQSMELLQKTNQSIKYEVLA